MAAAASSNLAPPQVKFGVRVSCMNLGGASEEFMRNGKKEKMYKERLPIEVNALLHGNDIVGLTEINPYWYQWLTESHGLTKPPQKYKAVHDGDDCAIIWDSSKVQPIFPASPRKLTLSYNPGDIPDGANAARFNWRGFMLSLIHI